MATHIPVSPKDAPLLSMPMRYFLAVAQAGSVNAAAAALFVAGSAVSRQVARLEESLGTPLFERLPRGMRLTPAGEHLAAHLRNAQLDAQQAIEQARDLAGEHAGRVRLACTEGFAAGFMPPVMEAFQAAHPGSRIELHVGAPDEVSRLLARGEADLGLKYAVAPEPGLRQLHTATAPVYAVMRPGHPLARRRVVALAELVRHPLSLGPAGVTTRQLFDMACAAHGLQYRAAFVSNVSAVLLALLRTPGVLLAGHLTVLDAIGRGEVVARPIDEPLLQQRRMQLLALEGRTLPALAQACAGRLVADIGRAALRRLGRARGAA